MKEANIVGRIIRGRKNIGNKQIREILCAFVLALVLAISCVQIGTYTQVFAGENLEESITVSNAEELREALANDAIREIILVNDIEENTSAENSKSSTALFTADRTITIRSEFGETYTIKRTAESDEVAKSLFEIWGNGEYDGIKVTFMNVILDGGAIWDENSTAASRYSGSDSGSGKNSGVRGRAILDVANKGTLILENGCIVQNGDTNSNIQTRSSMGSGHTGSGSSNYGGGVRIEYDASYGGGTVNLKINSVIQDVTSGGWGGAIGAYNFGRLNVYGGTIRRCSSNYGAAICCTYRSQTGSAEASVMKMYGGLIEDCYSSGTGVIYMDGANPTLNEIYGGTIRNCGDYSIEVNGNAKLVLPENEKGAIVIENISRKGNYAGNGYDSSTGLYVGSSSYLESKDSYFITFVDDNENLGSIAIAAGSTAGDSFPDDLSREDKLFLGWYDAEGNKITKDTEIHNDVVVYSKWHAHKWKFVAETHKLVAQCQNTDGNCFVESEDKSVVLMVSAESKTYSGTPMEVSHDDNSLAEIKFSGEGEWSKYEFTMPTITYVGVDGTVYNSTEPPTEIGNYCVQMCLEIDDSEEPLIATETFEIICGHDINEEIQEKFPTCTVDGHIAYTLCKRCNEKLLDGQVVSDDEIKLAASHVRVFTVNGNRLTVSCERKSDCKLSDKTLTLTVSSVSYTGKAVTAKYGAGETDAWKKAGYSVPTIKYYVSKGEGSTVKKNTTALASAPKEMGTYVAEAVYKDSESGKKYTIVKAFSIKKIPVQKLKLSKTSVGLSMKEKLTLKVTVTPSNATNMGVTWTSSNTKVATVSSAGVVTAVAPGTATITCKAKDGSGKSATCMIQVYTNTEAFVARIYTKALGREPEAAGLAYWTGEINAKRKNPVAVAELFIFSPEFEGKKLNDTEYIKVLYRTFMGREYDQAGLNYWLGEMKKGKTRKQVLESFASCPEFQKIIASFGL